MRRTRGLLQQANLLVEALRAPEDEVLRQVRPFYWFVILVMAGMYLLVLAADPSVRAPGTLALFTALLALHSWLHWVSPRVVGHPRRLLLYLLLQSGLVLAITLVVPNDSLLICLYMSLLGSGIGLLQGLRPTVLVSAALVALYAINRGLALGWDNLRGGLTGMAAMATFVPLFVFVFRRQLNAWKEARQLLRELEVAHSRLAEYSEKVEALTLAAERQRMARELHDTLAQGLAGLILELEALEAQLARGDVERAGRIAGQAKERARATLAEARRTITDLRSRPGGSGSLMELLQGEAERFSMATGIPCDLDLATDIHLPDPMAESLSRYAAEGLANVARHARASRARIGATVEGRDLLVEIRDNGVGFDPAGVEGQAGHYGLLGLRERARLAGGTLEVESAPGTGTTLRLHLPLQEEAASR